MRLEVGRDRMLATFGWDDDWPLADAWAMFSDSELFDLPCIDVVVIDIDIISSRSSLSPPPE